MRPTPRSRHPSEPRRNTGRVSPGIKNDIKLFFLNSVSKDHSVNQLVNLVSQLLDMARYRAQNGKMCFLCFMYFMCFFAAKPKKIWAGIDVF